MVIEWFRVDTETGLSLPYYPNGISAGFPNPAQDFSEQTLDLNKLLIKNRVATYYIKVEGDSMNGRGIYNGDILLVDKSMRLKNGDVGVFSINNEYTVKELLIDKGSWVLMPANDKYPPIPITKDMECAVWARLLM